MMKWLDELEEDPWDRQIEEDVKAGKTDFLKAQALEAKAKVELRCLPTK